MSLLAKFGVIVLFFLCSNAGHAQSEQGIEPISKPINLAATQWCPYICEGENQRGFIVEFLEHIFSQQNIELNIDLLPWSRAIYAVRNGDYDGLLTSTEAEAPGLLFPNFASGYYQMCFFGNSDSHFSYKDRSSLSGVVLGVIDNYGYGEPIDSIILSPKPKESIYSIASSNPLEQLINMTKLNRVDVFIEDKHVVEHYWQTNGNQEQLKQLSCFDEIPFYTAISPQSEHKEQLLILLNSILQSSSAKSSYKKFRKAYAN